MENYGVFLLFALVVGVFSAFGFYMGRIYQNYLSKKKINKILANNGIDGISDLFNRIKECLEEIKQIAPEHAKELDELIELTNLKGNANSKK